MAIHPECDPIEMPYPGIVFCLRLCVCVCVRVHTRPFMLYKRN